MNEPVIQWSAIILFLTIVGGSIVINLWLQWREKKRRRVSRGFRSMKSTAHHQRERIHHRSQWQQPAHMAARSDARRSAGWR